MEKKKEQKIEIKIESLNIGTLKVPIKGKTPLLMDKFPEETKKAILAKQSGITKSNKNKIRNTERETTEAVHYTSKGEVGFPAEGFKRGMMECTSFVGDKFFSRKLIQGVRIINTIEGLIPINYKKQDVLVHNVKEQTKFSPQFHDWSCELVIQYDQNNLCAEDLIRLLNYAGFYVGVGAWRPKGRDGGSGEFGMYEVSLKGGK